MEPQSNLLIYQSEDGVTRIETRLEGETVWLTQAQMADLFQKERSVITKHISNVFADGELDEKSNVQILHISGSDKPVKFRNLDEFWLMVGNDVLQHAGLISHDQAVKKAELEYAKYKEKTKNELSKVEKDFVAFIDTTAKSLESKKKK